MRAELAGDFALARSETQRWRIPEVSLLIGHPPIVGSTWKRISEAVRCPDPGPPWPRAVGGGAGCSRFVDGRDVRLTVVHVVAEEEASHFAVCPAPSRIRSG